MPVASNTSPILNLAAVDLLRLPQGQFGEVIIPRAVMDELRLESNYPGTDGIQKAISAGWLRLEAVRNKEIVAALKRELDDGEAEAIALALQLQTQTILMDERERRSVAKVMGLNPIGILGILMRAKEDGELNSVKDILTRLQNETGFYLASDLMREILSKIGE
ncbi:MAG: DUF3368 domain-containing protein [Anaerolineales bacterium]|nr:MAG: DUF3368 domain-containing protein [Anaerolineales bacterium]